MPHSPNTKCSHIKNSYNPNELEELKIEKLNTDNAKSSHITSSNLVYNIVGSNRHESQIHNVNKVTPAPVEQQIEPDQWSLGQLKTQNNLDLSTRIVNSRKYEVK